MKVSQVVFPICVYCVAATSGSTDPVDLRLRLNLWSGSAHTANAGAFALPMVNPENKDGVRLNWALPSALSVQQSVKVTLTDSYTRRTIYQESHVTSYQNISIPLSFQAGGDVAHVLPASVYSISVDVIGTSENTTTMTIRSVPLKFYTCLDEKRDSAGEGGWDAKPIWIDANWGPNDPSNTSYAWFRGSLALPKNDAVVSAIAFVSAEAPVSLDPRGCCGEAAQGSKIIAAYRLILNGHVLGIGPGKSSCGAVPQGACDSSTPYDGYALDLDTIQGGNEGIDVEIHAYGQHQSLVDITPRVVFQLVVRTVGGKVLMLSTNERWEGFDANALYNGTGNSGCRWYYYPHENQNARQLPAAKDWGKVVVKPGLLAPLKPKTVPPMSYSYLAQDEIQLVASGDAHLRSRFAFALPSEIQGGVRLTLANIALWEGVYAHIALSEEMTPGGLPSGGSGTLRPREPLRATTVYTSNFTLASGVTLEHHEYATFRFGEISFFHDPDMTVPLAIPDGELSTYFNLTVWVTHFPYPSSTRTTFNSSSAALNRVWAFVSNSVKHLLIDSHTDSAARQRSFACQADATVANLASYAANAGEYLGWSRVWTKYFMMFSAIDTGGMSANGKVHGHNPHPPPKWTSPPPPRGSELWSKYGKGGYRSASWADWTVLSALNVVNDAFMTGDLSLAREYFDWIVGDLSAGAASADAITLDGHTYGPPDPSSGVDKGHLLLYWLDSVEGSATENLVVDKFNLPPNNKTREWFSALVDTSGGSDDGFVQSPANSVVQAWTHYALREVAKLGRWIGETKTADILDSRAEAMRSSFQHKMVRKLGLTPTMYAVCDGLCAPAPSNATQYKDIPFSNHTALHSSFYALAFGLLDGPDAAAIKQGVFEYIQHRLNPQVSPIGYVGGSYPVQFLLQSLYQMHTREGANAALDVLTLPAQRVVTMADGSVVHQNYTHGWLSMMDNYNATTTMEAWTPIELPTLTTSHIWSASPAFAIPFWLAGVYPATPGWETVIVKPQPGDLEFFHFKIETVRGVVSAAVTQRFSHEENSTSVLEKYRLAVKLPGNTRARLFAPRPPTGCLQMDGAPAVLAEGMEVGEMVEVAISSSSVLERVLEWC